MVKRVLTAMVLSLSTFSAQAEPLHYNLLEFSESASMEVARDTMSVRLEVSQEGKDRAEVNREFVRKLNAVTKRIEANRLFKSEQLGRNAYPQYQYKNGKRIQIGWRESAEIKVESKDFAALNRLIAEVQNEANLEMSRFYVSKQKREEVIDKVSKAALLRFKDRADTLSKTLGFSSYKIVRLNLGQVGNHAVNENMAYAPMVMRAAKVSDSMGEVADVPSPGVEEISITVSGSVQM